MPAHQGIFKRADFGRLRRGIGCFGKHGYNARGCKNERTSHPLHLTSYRPNFCCECGEKIVRLRWRFWTSRKFCDRCFRRSWKDEWLQRVVVTIGLLLAGLLAGRGCRHERPPLVIERPVQPPSQAATPTQSPGSGEQFSICGARTKKGKPCSRRVHGPVRCWQHKGLPAMLPAAKLVIRE